MAFSLRLLVKWLDCFVVLGFIVDFLPLAFVVVYGLGYCSRFVFICWGNYGGVVDVYVYSGILRFF